MGAPHLLVHEKKDTVGVVVVEGLKAGTDMLCVVTHDNTSFNLTSKMDVPIGHKIALVDIKAGDTVWIPPGEKHWHGAAPTTGMVHLAMQEALDGVHVDWMEHVTDEQYGVPVGD